MTLLLLLACAPDDVTDRSSTETGDTSADADTDADTDTDTDTDADVQDIVGSWVSEGSDLAPLLSGEPFNYASIHASFDAAGAYTVTATDQDGQSGTLQGTFVTSTATTPGTITLTQSAPYTATAQGIWQVAAGVLTYEVVQVDPDYGFTAPTPDAGFGSTQGDGLAAGDNVQVYRAD